MGAGASSGLGHLLKAVQENDATLTEVHVERRQLSQKGMKKLSHALSCNK